MEKRFKNGLCLGKFMPIHNGHVHFILEAAKQCETVHVMICSRLCEPISGSKRRDWAESIFEAHPNINVILCEDENPQYPEDHPDFWKIWHDSVYSYIPKLDAVFGSEDYIEPFAACLKVEGVIVDKDRTSVPVSGTAIRTAPFDNWDYIPDVVKEEYRLKVAVVGPESSGKSTLCKKLGEYYGGVVVKEYGRWYTENITPAKDLKPVNFTEIAWKQYCDILNAEYRAQKNGVKCIFTDTEAIVTRTFLDMYAELNGWDFEDIKRTRDKVDEYMELEMFGRYGNRMGKIDLYLLAYPDLDWEDDGTRDFEAKEARIESYKSIKYQLDKHGCNYHVVMGKGDLRTEKAIKLINHSEKELREKPWHKLSFER